MSTDDLDDPVVILAGTAGPDGAVRPYPVRLSAASLLYDGWPPEPEPELPAPRPAPRTLDSRVDALEPDVAHLAEAVAALEDRQ
jgi:hypothetical protein